jgi:hypothetical protein
MPPDIDTQISELNNTIYQLKQLYATTSIEKGHVKSYQIGDRRMEFASPEDFIKKITFFQNELKRLNQLKALYDGTGLSNRINVRM